MILAMPGEGDVRIDDLRNTLRLTHPAINMRVAKAKQLGLIERSAWGVYRLTDEGRKTRGRRLQAVADE